MTKVLAGITTSVDGYIAGPDDKAGRGLGEGGERLHYWVFGGPWTYEAEPDGEATGEDAEWLREAMSGLGAVVGGRYTYEAGRRRSPRAPGSRSSRASKKQSHARRRPQAARTSTSWVEPTSCGRHSRPTSSTSSRSSSRR